MATQVTCECGHLPLPGEHHCWIHHADEQPDDAFMVCFECSHVYRRDTDLEAAWRRGFPEWPEHYPNGPKKAADIYFCPECLHDF